MRTIYICDYPYTLYSALIKASSRPDEHACLLLTNSIPSMESMLEPLRKSGIFQNVFFFNDTLFHETVSKIFPYTSAHNASTSFFMQFYFLLKGFLLILKSQHKAKSLQLPVNLFDYDTIYYSDRMSSLMFYLNKKKIPYIAMEHGKNVWSTKLKSEIIKMKIFSIFEKLHISCGINCYTKACKGILVNDKSIIKYKPKQAEVIEWNIDHAIADLSVNQKQNIYFIYANAYDLHLEDQKYNLLLTNPLYIDSYLPSEEQQLAFYRDQAKEQFDSAYPLLVKAHPRDKADYRKVFPHSIIINSSISIEVLLFCKGIQFQKVVTVFSSSIGVFAPYSEQVVQLVTDTFDPNNIPIMNPYRN